MLKLNGSRLAIAVVLSLLCATCVTAGNDADLAPENEQTGAESNEALELGGAWTFRYDKETAELTATHGTETKVYRLREMGESGELIQEALKNTGATTWTLPYTPDPVGASQYTAAICQAAAGIAAGLGCAAVTTECAVGATISAGSLVIPCALIIVLACGAGAAGGPVVASYCPSR